MRPLRWLERPPGSRNYVLALRALPRAVVYHGEDERGRPGWIFRVSMWTVEGARYKTREGAQRAALRELRRVAEGLSRELAKRGEP